MRKYILFFILVSSVFGLSGCFATKQDSLNMRLELREIRKELREVRKINADIKLELDNQNLYLQQIGGKIDEGNDKVSDLTLRRESLKDISDKLSAVEDKLLKLWVSTAPISMALPEDIFDMAKKDYIRGNYDLAIFGYNRLIEEYPEHSLVPSAYYELSQVYYAKGLWKKSIEMVDMLENLYPIDENIPNSLLVKARALRQMGEHAEAKKIFQRIEKDYPITEEAKIAKDELVTLKL